MTFFIHKLSDVQTKNIGNGSTIWQFVVILKNAIIGNNCNINASVFIENDVIIGSNTTIKSGVQIWDGITIQDNVFIGPNVTFTNDLFPRSKKHPKTFSKTLIMSGASIGANATILAGNTIGKYSLIGAGSVVTKDVGDNELWVGNPAKKIGFVTDKGDILNLDLISKNNKSKYRWSNKKLILIND